MPRLGPDHPTTARSLTNLARVLRDQGDLAGARTRFERSLAIYEASLGLDHSYTALGLDNLATVLHDEGDLAGARRLHEHALAIRETPPGPPPPRHRPEPPEPCSRNGEAEEVALKTEVPIGPGHHPAD